MKLGARSLILLAMMTACTPSSQTDEERAAAAARADSSAAGYDVGSGPAASPSGDSAPPITGPSSAPGPNDGRGAGTAPGSLAVAAGDSARGSRAGGSSSSRGQTDGATGASRGQGSPAQGREPRRDSVTVRIPPLDPALEPDFLVYDTVRKTATFQLAASDEVADRVSFNGAPGGTRTLTVPLGWRVTIAFANRDPSLPHSATIVDVAGPVPEQLPAAVFQGGQTMRLAEGLLDGDSDEISFTADRVGRYLLACGVLGHAQRGQWITFEVSPVGARPTYR